MGRRGDVEKGRRKEERRTRHGSDGGGETLGLGIQSAPRLRVPASPRLRIPVSPYPRVPASPRHPVDPWLY